MASRQQQKRPRLAELDALAARLDVPTPADAYIDGSSECVWNVSEQHRASIPADLRSTFGIHYTPPVVAERLLDDLLLAGARFDGTQTYCDPACGGGAFLVPVAQRMAPAIKAGGGTAADLARRLIGIDIDRGGLAITRAALDALAIRHFGVAPQWNLTHANTIGLALRGKLPRADVVVGNPPFGRVTLSPVERSFFARSTRGHANLYSIFVDLAMRITDGPIGYVMPTSWLAGDYFAALRELVSAHRPLQILRFIEARTGVFPHVLQEMCLAVMGASAGSRNVRVFAGFEPRPHWRGPVCRGQPWLLPRDGTTADLLRGTMTSRYRIADYGYRVHTGPLVWNRHRDQLRGTPGDGAIPIIWSDAVRPGREIEYLSSKRDFRFLDVGKAQHLVLRSPAVLVKRTTAKEQERRLIAASFTTPPAVVENHLNMVVPGSGALVPIDMMCALLNSEAVDRLFRCLSGSVAVSASELAALPLPPPVEVAALPDRSNFEELVAAAYATGDA